MPGGTMLRGRLAERAGIRFAGVMALVMTTLAATCAACGADPKTAEPTAEDGYDDDDPTTGYGPPPALCDAVGVAGDAYVAGVNCRTLDVDGYPREFLVYVPADHTFTVESPAPVVLMFHGGSQTGKRFLFLSRWRDKADEVGLIAVFPTALRYILLEDGRLATQWHDIYLAAEADLTRRPPGYPASAPWPADDVAFVHAMLDDLEAGTHIDLERLYATGFSNGAAFTARLAVEATDRLAAFAYVGARFCDPLDTDWTAAPPRPVVMVLGTMDAKVMGHIVGGDTTALDPLPLDADSLLDHEALTACLESPVAVFDLAWKPFDVLELKGETHITWSTPLDQPRRNSFQFIVLEGLGHRYPNGDNNPLDWDAADEFWEFFRDLRS